MSESSGSFPARKPAVQVAGSLIRSPLRPVPEASASITSVSFTPTPVFRSGEISVTWPGLLRDETVMALQAE